MYEPNLVFSTCLIKRFFFFIIHITNLHWIYILPQNITWSNDLLGAIWYLTKDKRQMASYSLNKFTTNSFKWNYTINGMVWYMAM